MKRVILAFDSFKGCASSQEIAASARQGIIDVFPECAVVVVPVAMGVKVRSRRFARICPSSGYRAVFMILL